MTRDESRLKRRWPLPPGSADVSTSAKRPFHPRHDDDNGKGHARRLGRKNRVESSRLRTWGNVAVRFRMSYNRQQHAARDDRSEIQADIPMDRCSIDYRSLCYFSTQFDVPLASTPTPESDLLRRTTDHKKDTLDPYSIPQDGMDASRSRQTRDDHDHESVSRNLKRVEMTWLLRNRPPPPPLSAVGAVGHEMSSCQTAHD